MLKSDKLYNATSSLIAGILFLIIALCMLLGKGSLYFSVIELFLLFLLILATLKCFRFFFSKKEEKENFIQCVLNLLFCIFLATFPKIPMSFFPLLFAIYLLANAIIKFINYILLLKSKTNGRIKEFIRFIFYLLISIPILCAPLKNIEIVLTILGIYILCLSLTYFIDFFRYMAPQKTQNKLKRRLRITLPVFIEAIIPYQVLNEINSLVDEKEEIYVQTKKEKQTVDMTIFIHTAKNGFNRIGHVDICYQNTVISYGNYDNASFKFFEMIGDGVLFLVNKEKYIPFCIKHSKKTLFSFGIHLNKMQKKNIENYLKELYQNTYKWEPPIVTDKQKKKEYTDYSSCLYKETNAKFYKFTSGKFKKYFVMGSNCCLLADSIIGKSGSNILKMNGMITPGTYYEYLNKEFQRKNSMVITKEIYNEKRKKDIHST